MLDTRCYTWPDWTSDSSTDWLSAGYIDRDRHLIEYLTRHILYYVLSTLLFIYFIHAISYFSIYIFFICSHVISTCTFQFILTHSLEAWLTGFAYPDLWLNITDQVLGEDHRHLEEPEFSLTRSSILDIFYLFFILLLSWLYALDLCLFYSFIYLLSCVDVYMWHCSDVDLP